MSEEIIGTVSDFFAHPVVAGIELTAALKIGDKIHIKIQCKLIMPRLLRLKQETLLA
jgi:hypothetical protein